MRRPVASREKVKLRQFVTGTLVLAGTSPVLVEVVRSTKPVVCESVPDSKRNGIGKGLPFEIPAESRLCSDVDVSVSVAALSRRLPAKEPAGLVGQVDRESAFTYQ